MKSKKTAGMDLGFMRTKIAYDLPYSFPSLIGNPSIFEIDDFYSNRETISDLELEYEGDTYYVGDRAKDTTNARQCIDTVKTDSLNEKVIYRTALGILSENTDKLTLSIVTGLPVEDFKQNGLKDKVIENMQGQFSFIFRKKPCHVNVEKVTVIPQSAGAYYDYVLDDDGNLKEDVAALAEGVVIVIDVGYKTTDVVTMINGAYDSKRSFTLVKGMRDIHKELIRLIRFTLDMKFSLHEADDLCKAGTLSDSGKMVDITPHIAKATKPIAEAILTEISATMGDTRVANRVLGTGGTIELLEQYFASYYGETYQTSESKDMANANGYRKFGRMTDESNNQD